MWGSRKTSWDGPAKNKNKKKTIHHLGSGCDTVGKVVASDTRDLRFESSHRQILFAINCTFKSCIEHSIILCCNDLYGHHLIYSLSNSPSSRRVYLLRWIWLRNWIPGNVNQVFIYPGALGLILLKIIQCGHTVCRICPIKVILVMLPKHKVF